MVAAENGGLPRGKVGGLGDVIRELPQALARLGHRVTVLTPAYGFLARLPGARRLGSVTVTFAGETETAAWLEVPSPVPGVTYQLLDHPRFTPGGTEAIYHDDAGAGPFATDATKFAFLSAAAAELLSNLETRPDVIHLHDWHTGLMLLLRGFDPACRMLKPVRSVFTIHNLALQGTRPVTGTEASLSRWFPELDYPPAVVADPRFAGCANPMAVGIRLAEAVSTVSPTYAAEILEPPDAQHGRPGGEGLEGLVIERQRQGALTGILNGCDYAAAKAPKPSFKALLALIESELKRWIASGRFVDSAAFLALDKLRQLPRKRPRILATSVGRVTEQKLGLMRQAVSRSATALDRVLAALDGGLLILLGSGDAELEQFLEIAEIKHDNFLFLHGFSEQVAEALYAAGELFLMPSVFEPCGISQMLAMRAGQPCVAHAVGGLKDTVSAANGFPFGGETPRQQAQNFAREVAAAIDLKLERPGEWRRLVDAARRARFSWDASARVYLDEVYAFDACDRT